MLIFNKRDERYILIFMLIISLAAVSVWGAGILWDRISRVCKYVRTHVYHNHACVMHWACVCVCGRLFHYWNVHSSLCCTGSKAVVLSLKVTVLNVCTLNSKAFRNVWITIHSSSYSVPSWICSCQKWSIYCSFHWITLLCFLCLVQNSSALWREEEHSFL